MKKIYKYPFILDDEIEIEMPENAKIVLVGRDPVGLLSIWAEVDPEATVELRKLHMRGTGHPVDGIGVHVQSFVDGQFVWHLYDEG